MFTASPRELRQQLRDQNMQAQGEETSKTQRDSMGKPALDAPQASTQTALALCDGLALQVTKKNRLGHLKRQLAKPRVEVGWCT